MQNAGLSVEFISKVNSTEFGRASGWEGTRRLAGGTALSAPGGVEEEDRVGSRHSWSRGLPTELGRTFPQPLGRPS